MSWGKVLGKNSNGKPMSRMIRAIAIPKEQNCSFAWLAGPDILGFELERCP